jgi:thioredoxin 1
MVRIISSIIILFVLGGCSKGQTQQNLSASEFASKLKEYPAAPILDVRTSGEFSKGHLNKAINIDWNNRNFETKIASLDKTKPVFVYCLSGSRSADAAKLMRSIGFKEVYELQEGLIKWRGANLPVTTNTASASGMTLQDFNKMIDQDKIVLVDFYADWCGPCKKMEPYLKEISNEMADRVVLIRINTDDNQELCQDLKIDAIPVLQIYKDKKLTWNNIGYIGKEDVLKQLH